MHLLLLLRSAARVSRNGTTTTATTPIRKTHAHAHVQVSVDVGHALVLEDVVQLHLLLLAQAALPLGRQIGELRREAPHSPWAHHA